MPRKPTPRRASQPKRTRKPLKVWVCWEPREPYEGPLVYRNESVARCTWGPDIEPAWIVSSLPRRLAAPRRRGRAGG